MYMPQSMICQQLYNKPHANDRLTGMCDRYK